MKKRMNSPNIKSVLLKKCSDLVLERHQRIIKSISDIESSLKDESKSTSGDKHHTGRAMLQIEREQLGKQLNEIVKVQRQLDKVEIHPTSERAKLGSLVHTNHGTFFLSISVGSLQAGNANYLGVAPNSPIGILLLGKKAGNHFTFKQREYFIWDID